MGPERMMKKGRIILAALSAVGALLLPGAILQAKELPAYSQGNLEGMEARLKLYGQDMDYLHREIGQLLSECE